MQKFQDSFQSPYTNTKKNNTNNIKKTKIVINVSQTQYSVVKHIAKKLKWNLYLEPVNNLNFDICWMDGHVRQELFARMQNNQKINHFPGMGILSRKNNLGKNLMLFRKKFTSQYQFFPITWTLPAQYQQLQTYHQCRQQGKAQTFIVKPQASCQGRGIFLTRNIQKLKNDKYVVQRYMHKPYLIDGLKFDLRIYVLVTGIDPLRIFVYEEGLARFATQPYKAPRSDNLDNKFMHLTNYAVNKQNPNFVFNQSVSQMDVGHKRSLTSVYKQIQEDGHDVSQLKRKINDIFIKTIITGYPTLSNTFLSIHPDNFANDMCFQILGFDIMIDYKLNPSLIQINYTPSFSTDTPLDRHIKKNLIYDTIQLLNINDKWKKQMKQKRDKQIQQRMVSGKRKKYTNQQRRNLMFQQAKKRNLHQQQNMGKFTKIFLLNEDQMNQYKKYYDFSYQLYNHVANNNTINNINCTIQYPFYKYYFQNSNKPQYYNGSVSKAKKFPLKQTIKQSNITKITQTNIVQKTRQQLVGSSQGRRISSAKSKKVRKQLKNQMQQKISSKTSLKNQDQIQTKDIMQFQPCIDNESIFQNKKIQQLMILKKRKSQALLLDHENFIHDN